MIAALRWLLALLVRAFVISAIGAGVGWFLLPWRAA